MPRKKTGLASSTKKRYIKSTCHCLILCQNIVGGLYTVISEGKFTQSSHSLDIEISKYIIYNKLVMESVFYHCLGGGEMSDFFMCIAQYVIILLVLVAIGGIGGFVGVKLRKRKDAKAANTSETTKE